MNTLSLKLAGEIEQLVAKNAGDFPMQSVLDLVLRAAGGQGGTIHVLDGLGPLRIAAASANIPPQVLEAVREVPIGKGMAGVAAQRREPVTTCDLQLDNAGGVARPNAKKTGFRGSICVPMIATDGRLAGTLGIGCAESREFTEAEVGALLAAGKAVADALGRRDSNH
ncbi:MAG: GAF domain-containing protein [Planctomycetes bacterium]|nr:GAF domain-containing protein [Planctomycetota bacterium]